MADGSLTIPLDELTAEQLKAAAEAAGETPEAYVRRAVARSLEEDWAEDLRRAAEYERTGESLSVDEAFDLLRTRIAERRAQRG
ncbi:hypothetical protein [Caulobacter mirabilis]|uniref:CopG family transcriptional regulator n=1 Tax=Caulobacter mirabilis TaxID=69666 RepID=A0A2D2AYD6_9CAUL|nr:hypothetical protein [Caulobacter mirabilis]ATQ43029.1 hypothetical protein CSW64_11720 [Caulobacter mirabilis]